MPRKTKTPDEIFTITRKYEPDRQAEVKALQIVLEANKKRLQQQNTLKQNKEAI